MLDFWSGLLRADFLPHGWCYRWDPNVVLLHVVSDLLIALAYYFIPFALLFIVRRRGDLAFPCMFGLFGLFILACGTTHLMSVVVVWYPWYRLDGVIKLITALASVPTAILLLRIAPSVVMLPSPSQLRRVNEQLAAEIAERREAEDQVRRLNADLERRVAERTADLEKAIAQLREGENRLRSILDSSPTLVSIKDPGGRFLFVNRHFEQCFDTRREDVLGKTDFDLFPQTLAESYATADREVIGSGEPREFEEIAFPSGRMHTYMSVKSPLRDVSGNVYALCSISSDITERKRAEDSLRKYNQELEQFAHVAAHDLQEPLRTVKSFSQLLARQYAPALDSTGREFIDYITGGVDRMRSLVTALQSYSEVDRDREPAEMVPLNEIFENTVRVLSTAIQESGATVTRGNLPVLPVSRVHLQQLLQNLIGNAIKYRSGEPPKIHISSTRTSRECEIVVVDNGIGMDMRYADQIFRVFKRLHGREIPGTGIGLAICKKVVESYGGRIWVVSELNKGSEFHFTLPC
jgi:PAS domain S-box-containing protein